MHKKIIGFTLRFRTPSVFIINTLFVLINPLDCLVMRLETLLNKWQSVDPDKKPLSAASDLCKHCLLKSVCPNT